MAVLEDEAVDEVVEDLFDLAGQRADSGADQDDERVREIRVHREDIRADLFDHVQTAENGRSERDVDDGPADDEIDVEEAVPNDGDPDGDDRHDRHRHEDAVKPQRDVAGEERVRCEPGDPGEREGDDDPADAVPIVVLPPGRRPR